MKRYKCSGLIILAATATGILFAGCAGTSSTSSASANTKSLLSTAGFRVRTPETPQQQEIYASLPANKVERAAYKGKTFYVYKDEAAGVAYVGREPEYQRYKQLSMEKKVEPTLYMSEDMDTIQSQRFYGEWGAQVIWR